MRIVELKIPQNLHEANDLARAHPTAWLAISNFGWCALLLLLWATGHLV